MPLATNLDYIRCAIQQLSSGSFQCGKEKKEDLKALFKNSDFLVNCLASDKVISALAEEMLSRAKR